MKKILVVCLLLVGGRASLYAQQKTIQERLGYPKDTRLVIVHADDLGVSHSENVASIQALEKGSVSSASIMVPCPWFGEIADYAKSHPKADLGLHLTLTSEWKHYKWGSVMSPELVPGLNNSQGFLYDGLEPLYKNGKAGEAEKEFRAQVERAKQFGINPTHLDSHMGSAFFNVEYLDAYIKVGREYKIPVLMVREALATWLKADPKNVYTEKEVLVDRVLIADPADYKAGMEQFYLKSFKTIQPGLTYLILHAALDNDEMKAVTIDHPDFGAAWRQADFNFFTSAACKKALADEHIVVITWGEIKNKLY